MKYCILTHSSKGVYSHIKTYIFFMLNQEEYFSDSVRHAEGGTVVLVRSTDRRQARSSPTQRKCFVCNYCLAGARHGHPFDSPDTEISPSNYIPYNRTIYGKPTEEVLNSYGVKQHHFFRS
jgi:hypothetical protein